MLAGVIHGQRDVRIESASVPRPAAGEVLIAVEAALTDGTDLKVFRRGYHARMIRPPMIFGHEFAGSVAAVGEGVEGWQLGDAVVAANSAPCGHCFYCDRNQEALCEDLLFVNGAYASFILLPSRLVEKNLLRIPDGLSPAHAAFTEPLACVVKGINDLHLEPGASLAVIGSGPIGLMAACAASDCGAEVLLLGRHPEQLAAGRKLGAAETALVSSRDDVLDALLRPCGGRGPDAIFEATGLPDVWEAAIQSVRRGGIVNLFGGCPADTRVSFDTNRVHYGEVRLCSSFHHNPASIRAALQFLADRRLQPDLLLDGREPLSHLPEVLQEMDTRVRTMKTVINPPGVQLGLNA